MHIVYLVCQYFIQSCYISGSSIMYHVHLILIIVSHTNHMFCFMLSIIKYYFNHLYNRMSCAHLAFMFRIKQSMSCIINCIYLQEYCHHKSVMRMNTEIGQRLIIITYSCRHLILAHKRSNLTYHKST